MVPGGILALDLATTTGWAYGHAGDDPLCGTWGPEPGSHPTPGVVGLGVENELDRAIQKLSPVLIAYEAPLAADQQTHAHTAFLLIGLAFCVEVTAARWRIRCQQRRSDTARSAVIGRAHPTDEEKRRFPTLTVKKAIVLPWIEARGWKVPNHDAADAAVIWAYETGWRHPLFNKRR